MSNCVDIIRSEPKRLTILKHIYNIKRSSYLYNVKNFFPYLVWDIIKKSHENLGQKWIISTLRVGGYTPKINK